MLKNQNEIIKFDLHIHSKASSYKEGTGIVDFSTDENIPTLLLKLNENNVSLFSITDHNRFDSSLYKSIFKFLKQEDNLYPNVKAVLPGIEFDVKIDENMSKCHIITIFDINSNFDNLEKIENEINKDCLQEENEAYSKDRFEIILKNIGLNTILIASQHKDIYNHSGKHSSLSDSTTSVEEIIKIGYIDAFEFQKPKVEGILINNLKNISLSMPLLSGSDCHDWRFYPNHSESNINKGFYHSKAKILPTFKGLLMAVTSPETRFNCQENMNSLLFTEIKLKEQIIPLRNGINVIIGENGSGKTTLLKLINNKVHEPHVKKIISDNNLIVDMDFDPTKIKYIEQGEIINKFNEHNLFSIGDDNNFEDIDTSLFYKIYYEYSQSIKNIINRNIILTSKLSSLKNYSISFEDDMNETSYFIDVVCTRDFYSVFNPHKEPLNEINDLLSNIEILLSNDYYINYKMQLQRIKNELHLMKLSIQEKCEIKNVEAKIKNIIYSCLNDYRRNKETLSSTKDKERAEYQKKKSYIIDSIIEIIKLKNDVINIPTEPRKIEGLKRNIKKGFYFNREATYNNVSMLSNFYSKMFNKYWNNIDKLLCIDSIDDFKKCIRNCTDSRDIEEKWNENFEKFISDAIKTKDYIVDSSEEQIGNTLGEMSLSYHKYFTDDDEPENWNVLIIDQPEDNISNNNIKQRLIKYFDSMRDKKQLIFVTHNPLLVVNLDVDNIIFVKNNNGILSIDSGCLEYENEEINILDTIAQNMDGGKETIERRLRIYGKSY